MDARARWCLSWCALWRVSSLRESFCAFLLGRGAPCWRMRGGLADDGFAGAFFVVKNDAENK